MATLNTPGLSSGRLRESRLTGRATAEAPVDVTGLANTVNLCPDAAVPTCQQQS